MTSATSLSSPTTSKRLTHPVSSNNQTKRQRNPTAPSQRTTIFCAILINDNPNGSLPNDVELGSHTFKELGFDQLHLSEHPYLLIANKLYRAASNALLTENELCINSSVYNQICSGIFTYDGADCVAINLPELPSVDLAKVSKVTFLLKPVDDLYENNILYSEILLTDLERDFASILCDRFLKMEQTFTIKLSSGLYFKVSIVSATYLNYPDNSNHTKLARTRYIYISEKTHMDFTAPKESRLTIIRQIETPPEHTELKFAVRALSSSQEYSNTIDEFGDLQFDVFEDLHKNQGTLVYPYHKLHEKVYSDLATRLIYPGTFRNYCINADKKIELTCKQITVQNAPHAPKCLKTENYRLGVFFDDRMKITLTPDSSLQLVKSATIPVKEIAFRVNKIIRTQPLNPMQPHRPYILMDEFRVHIRRLGIPFALRQKFQVSLSTGNFLIETMHAKTSPGKLGESASSSCSSDYDPEDTDPFAIPYPMFSQASSSEDPPYMLPSWEVVDNSSIHLHKDSLEALELMRNEKPLPLEEIKCVVQRPRFALGNIKIYREHLEAAIRELCTGPLLAKQPLNINCDGTHLRVTVDKLTPIKQPPKSSYDRFGKIIKTTKIVFESQKEQNIQIVSKNAFAFINNPELLIAELNMGGITNQASELIRRAVLPRGPLAADAKKRNIAPLKGILLYGPPGTGKSTLAKQLGSLFGCSLENGRLHMATASEIFEKWVGNSEANVRALFAPAREDSQKLGENAPLHVIVIDELDAAFGKRGDKGNSVRNSVVNQFLGELEGLNSLRNILVVGITNRKEDLDPAVIRKGRLGVHLEFGLPSAAEREEIFKIHTKHLKLENLLHEDVDLHQLAEKTTGLSGADIKDICDDAAILSLERLSKTPEKIRRQAREALGVVTMGDFLAVIEKRTVKSDMAKYVKDTMFL